MENVRTGDAHVDVHWLPAHLPPRELKEGKNIKKDVKMGGRGNQLTLIFVIGFGNAVHVCIERERE